VDLSHHERSEHDERRPANVSRYERHRKKISEQKDLQGGETHGGDDVAVYARGPGSAAVRGVFEQHVLFHLLVQAQPALRAAQAPPAE
jgi:alkaline phosphatase